MSGLLGAVYDFQGTRSELHTTKVEIAELHQVVKELVSMIGKIESNTELAKNNTFAIEQLQDSLRTLSDKIDENITNKTTHIIEDTTSNNIEKKPPLTYSEKISILEANLYNPATQDHYWPSEVTDKIDALFSNEPALSIKDSYSVQCNHTLCRINVSIPDNVNAVDRDLFEMTFFTSIGKLLPRSTMSIDIDPAGFHNYQFYMARDGYRLPYEPTPESEDND